MNNGKVGLYITTLLRDITDMGYSVEFSGDSFDGMMTLTYKGEGLDWTHHQHLGYPDCPLEHLEKEIIRSLAEFRDSPEGEEPDDEDVDLGTES